MVNWLIAFGSLHSFTSLRKSRASSSVRFPSSYLQELESSAWMLTISSSLAGLPIADLSDSGLESMCFEKWLSAEVSRPTYSFGEFCDDLLGLASKVC